MNIRNEDILTSLSLHPEPIIRWRTMRYLLEKPIYSSDLRKPWDYFDTSPILHQLLSDQKEDRRIPYHPYNKWFGSHWILSILADLGFPEGNQSIKPLLDQCYEWLLSKEHNDRIKMINGRVRRCASQEGNCIYYSLALGLADERTEELVERLITWQWEDGGWNCDKRPEAAISSFHETLIPLRGLALYANISGDPRVLKIVNQAAEVFLKRNLFKRIRDNRVIDENFMRLHYPTYWHYDILFALKVMAEAGYLSDPRCCEGLDFLENKKLPDGGFPAEAKYYRVDNKKLSGHSKVDWGGVSKIHANPFVTLDALIVLKKSSRLIL